MDHLNRWLTINYNFKLLNNFTIVGLLRLILQTFPATVDHYIMLLEVIFGDVIYLI